MDGQYRYRQSGAALFVALIMLLVITIFAISGLKEAGLESRITGNVVEQRRLQNAADAAVFWAENELAWTGPVVPNCTQAKNLKSGVCVRSKADQSTAPLSKDKLQADANFTDANLFDDQLDGSSVDRPTVRWYLVDISRVVPYDEKCYQGISECEPSAVLELNVQAGLLEPDKMPADCSPDVVCKRATIFVK